MLAEPSETRPYAGIVDQEPMPGRAVGLVPLCVGCLGLLLVIATSTDPGTGYTWIDWAFGPFLIAVGLGLLFSQRWAWAMALLLAVAGVLFGVIAVASPGDITELGLQIGGLILYLLPGAVVLAILLRPATLRWLLRRNAVSPLPNRLD